MKIWMIVVKPWTLPNWRTHLATPLALGNTCIIYNGINTQEISLNTHPFFTFRTHCPNFLDFPVINSTIKKTIFKNFFWNWLLQFEFLITVTAFKEYQNSSWQWVLLHKQSAIKVRFWSRSFSLLYYTGQAEARKLAVEYEICLKPERIC